MFRNNPLGSVLVSVLFILALFTCWISVRHFFTTRELYAIQVRYQSLQRTLNGVQSLANETLLYSQRNPAIDPVLQDLGLKARPSASKSPAPGQPATGQPAAPPGPKIPR